MKDLTEERHLHRRALSVARRRRLGEGPVGKSIGPSTREAARWLARAARHRFAIAALRGASTEES